MRQIHILLREPARRMRRQSERQLAPSNVDVRVMVGGLRGSRHTGDELDRGREGRKFDGADDRRVHPSPLGEGAKGVVDIGIGE